DYLSTSPRSPVVRFLDLPDTPRSLAVQPPLRLLHLVASPEDAPRLDVAGEAARLRSALTAPMDETKIEIVPGQPGTLAVLRDRLRQGCHAFHFSGHGGFFGETGYLLFEDDDGRGQPVTSDTLAQLFRDTGVRLALLNACESALAATGDAFSSVAAALVRAGLPAVIAHQYAMPDSSAQAFAAEFYDALTDDYPVDAAVSEGRKAILSELGEPWRAQVDWATPVLFMRAPEGRILALQEREQTGRQDQWTAPVVQIDQIKGEKISILDIGATAPIPSVPAPQPAADPLPALLDELRDKVRDQAPKARRVEALEKIATLRGAATERRPNLALMQSVLRWFEAELPSLSPPVLSAILGVKPRLEDMGDDLLWDFRERFGESP
ncbi:MAG: CHAT domain-containing protein, partial [Anaerolineae bacterium]